MVFRILKLIYLGSAVICLAFVGGLVYYFQIDAGEEALKEHFAPHREVVICDKDFNAAKNYIDNFLRSNNSPPGYFILIDPEDKDSTYMSNLVGKTYISIFGMSEVHSLCRDWTRFFKLDVDAERAELQSKVAAGGIDIETNGCHYNIEYHNYDNRPNRIRHFVSFNLDNSRSCYDKALTFFFSIFVLYDYILKTKNV